MPSWPLDLAVDHPAHDLNTDAYRALSPFEQIPAIEDDGLVLSESAAIVVNLAKKAGRLIPSDLAGEAQVLRRCFAATSSVEMPLLSLLLIDWAKTLTATSTARTRSLGQPPADRPGALARPPRVRGDAELHRGGHSHGACAGGDQGRGTAESAMPPHFSYRPPDPQVTRIQTDPDSRNARAIRCYEKAGFRAVGEVQTPDGAALLMACERPAGAA